MQGESDTPSQAGRLGLLPPGHPPPLSLDISLTCTVCLVWAEGWAREPDARRSPLWLKPVNKSVQSMFLFATLRFVELQSSPSRLVMASVPEGGARA